MILKIFEKCSVLFSFIYLYVNEAVDYRKEFIITGKKKGSSRGSGGLDN